MTRSSLAALLFLSSSSSVFACVAVYNVDFADMNARQVLVEGTVRSVQLDRVHRKYVFEIKVFQTLKGPAREAWVLTTPFRAHVFTEWHFPDKVYVGFDVVDFDRSVGQFPNFGCSPLGIVDATEDNLGRIRRNERGGPAF